MFEMWKQDLLLGKDIWAATNIFISPVSTENLISFIQTLANTKEVGLWNYTASDCISYYEAAILLATELDVSLELVQPDVVGPDKLNPDFMQKNVALNCAKILRDFSISVEETKDVLRKEFRKFLS